MKELTQSINIGGRSLLTMWNVNFTQNTIVHLFPEFFINYVECKFKRGLVKIGLLKEFFINYVECKFDCESKSDVFKRRVLY